MSKLIITCAMARYRYHGSHPFMSKARQAAKDRERRFLADHQHIPFLFGHTDDVAVAMRKRARDRMHTIHREQMFMRRYPPRPKVYRRPALRIKTTPVYRRRL